MSAVGDNLTTPSHGLHRQRSQQRGGLAACIDESVIRAMQGVALLEGHERVKPRYAVFRQTWKPKGN
jgi:hypothetical protein